MKPSSCLCLLLLASLLLVSSAVTVSPSETRRAARRARPTSTLPDENFLARLCDQQRGHPATMRRLPWCQQLHARRRGGGGGGHHVPMPLPGRDEEEIDVRYGVSKRLVPSGPNPLHN